MYKKALFTILFCFILKSFSLESIWKTEIKLTPVSLAESGNTVIVQCTKAILLLNNQGTIFDSIISKDSIKQMHCIKDKIIHYTKDSVFIHSINLELIYKKNIIFFDAVSDTSITISTSDSTFEISHTGKYLLSLKTLHSPDLTPYSHLSIKPPNITMGFKTKNKTIQNISSTTKRYAYFQCDKLMHDGLSNTNVLWSYKDSSEIQYYPDRNVDDTTRNFNPPEGGYVACFIQAQNDTYYCYYGIAYAAPLSRLYKYYLLKLNTNGDLIYNKSVKMVNYGKYKYIQLPESKLALFYEGIPVNSEMKGPYAAYRNAIVSIFDAAGNETILKTLKRLNYNYVHSFTSYNNSSFMVTYNTSLAYEFQNKGFDITIHLADDGTINAEFDSCSYAIPSKLSSFYYLIKGNNVLKLKTSTSITNDIKYQAQKYTQKQIFTMNVQIPMGFDINQKTLCTIYNLNGKIIKQMNIADYSKTFKLTSGIYIVNLKNSTGQFFSKCTVKN
jgi:hypothetical protein